MCGTAGCIAPEILKREKYGLSADMFSIGVIFYTLLTGRDLFPGED